MRDEVVKRRRLSVMRWLTKVKGYYFHSIIFVVLVSSATLSDSPSLNRLLLSLSWYNLITAFSHCSMFRIKKNYGFHLFLSPILPRVAQRLSLPFLPFNLVDKVPFRSREFATIIFFSISSLKSDLHFCYTLFCFLSWPLPGQGRPLSSPPVSFTFYQGRRGGRQG